MGFYDDTGRLTRQKILTGTTDADASTDIAHGLTKDDILSVNILITDASDNDHPPNRPAASNYDYSYYVDGTNIVLETVNANLQSKSYRCLIIYNV